MEQRAMGDFIAELRKQRNLTQKELADLLNITDKAVSKWERGFSCPDIASIPQLAEILGVSSEELLNCRRDFQTTGEATPARPSRLKQISHMIGLLLRAVALAMGIAVVVISVVGGAGLDSRITMLAIGLTAGGIAMVQDYTDRK